ncbi:MAG: hypothetical protein GY810_21330 [Aureispira sp.]|nr:hypothetical protein [Aureispira sp.]
MNKLFCSIAIYLLAGVASIYAIDLTDSTQYQAYEDDISSLAEEMLTNRDKQVRLATSQQLEEKLKEALEKDPELAYPFKNIKGVSILNAENKDFRIFTWQVYIDPDTYEYAGLIQTKDGSIHRLDDKSKDMRSPEFFRLKPDNWYGALYYGMHPFKHENKTMYLLFGYDAYSMLNKRKILEVLYFDHEGKPKFGKKVIQVKDGYGRTVDIHRYLIEYSATVSVGLKYSGEEKMVIFDHLIQTAPVPGQGPANVPDGSYCGLEWKDNKWTYVDKVYEDIPGNTLIEAETPQETIKRHNKTKDKKEKRDILGRRQKEKK